MINVTAEVNEIEKKIQKRIKKAYNSFFKRHLIDK